MFAAEPRRPISPETAWSLLEPHLSPLRAVEMPSLAALGFTLAADLPARLDLPASDVSAMDGYALGGDAADGTRLPVVDSVAAGDPPGAVLAPGSATRIMTGAPVPAGADRVVPVESTDRGERSVHVREWPPEGAHVRRRGEISRRGGALLSAGSVLTPGALALLASHGHDTLQVHRPPRVALLVTGDEVVTADREPQPGQLRDSHTSFLVAAGRQMGLAVETLGIAPDDEETLAARVTEGLGADLLLLTGGVSMGSYDYVPRVLERLGCETLFHRVAIQPGKPLLAARYSSRLVFGLPGNPASVMVGFWLFVRPALARLMGRRDGFWHGALQARLSGRLPAATDRDRFLPAWTTFRDGQILARPHAPRGSHDLGAYAAGTALVRVRPGAASARAGEPCELLPLADWPDSTPEAVHDRES